MDLSVQKVSGASLAREGTEGKMASIKSHPPKLSVGQGGPPETQVAHHLRSLRDAARAEWLALRCIGVHMVDSDRERRVAELNRHIRFLTEKIKQDERAHS